jgi:hypothetical protein
VRLALSLLFLGAVAGCSTDYFAEVYAPPNACWSVTTTEGVKHGYKDGCGNAILDLDDERPLSLTLCGAGNDSIPRQTRIVGRRHFPNLNPDYKSQWCGAIGTTCGTTMVQ